MFKVLFKVFIKNLFKENNKDLYSRTPHNNNQEKLAGAPTPTTFQKKYPSDKMKKSDNRVTLSPKMSEILDRLETVDQLTKTTKASIQEGLADINKVMATSEEVAQ